MKKYNVVWIYVDSVRNYHTEGDDRSRLSMMDFYGEESCEFLNAVTSAPSTWMSVTAMLTGLPSVFIAKNFNDFYFDNSYFDSIVKILSNEGYDCNFLLHSRRSRELFNNFCPIIDRKFWPKGLKHRYKKWPNKVLNMVLKNYLAATPKEPFFLFMGYNCRLDYSTSDVVDHAIKLFKSNGYNENNTIFVLCSDHGYPDPSKDWTPEKFKSLGIGHDLLLSDDNIEVPLFINYPGSPKGIKIPYVVSLIDVFPTIMSILSIYDDEHIEKKFYGKNLKPLIENKKSISDLKNRFVRTDNRLFCQDNRGTSIRGNSYKYLYYHDRPRGDNEEFYDLELDPKEVNNVLLENTSYSSKELHRYRKEFLSQQNHASKFQVEHSIHRLKRSIENEKSIRFADLSKILIFGKFPLVFLEHLSEIIKDLLSNGKVSYLLDDSLKDSMGFASHNDLDFFNSKKLSHSYFKNYDFDKFDLVLVPIDVNNAMTYDQHSVKSGEEIFAITEYLNSNKVFLLDYNMNIIRNNSSLKLQIKKKFWDKRNIYMSEPSLLLIDIFKYLSILLTKNKKVASK